MINERLIGLHTFIWKYTDIIDNIDTIKSNGYDYILNTPVQGIKQNAYDFWLFYQPLGFNIKDNILGTKDEYKRMIDECNKKGLKVIQDVVLRHTASCDNNPLKPNCKVDDIIRNNKEFYTNSENNNGNMDRWHTTHDQFGLPMIDYENKDVQNIQREFLHELKSIGVSGVRVDMGKHFLLPNEGGTFWDNVILKEFKNDFNFAECIDCSKDILDRYTKFIKVFSNTDCTDKSKMVSFICIHDTEVTWHSTSNKTDEIMVKEWEWLLQNNRESDVLFYPRPFNNLWKTGEIKRINNTYK